MARVILSALAYSVIVFPLAFTWHLVLFPEQYETFGYFTGEPDVALGMLTIVIQGIVLSIVYPMFRPGQIGRKRAFLFAGLMGVFFWTSHVLALVAKQEVPQAATYILMETGYLGLQFGLFALALALIYRRVN